MHMRTDDADGVRIKYVCHTMCVCVCVCAEAALPPMAGTRTLMPMRPGANALPRGESAATAAKVMKFFLVCFFMRVVLLLVGHVLISGAAG